MARRKPRYRPVSLAAVAACILILSPFAWSSQQQRNQHQTQNGIVELGQGSQPSLGFDSENTQYKRIKDTNIESNDPSASPTFAPARQQQQYQQQSDGVAVRAPSIVKASAQHPAGLRRSSLLEARSLQDWEVEDLILLATVDGSIYARDRKTGKHKWGPILADSPVIETIYHRDNASNELDQQYDDALGDFIWIVEPIKDGEIYLYNRAHHGALQKLHMTIKGLQESTPHASEDPAVVYYAEKTSTMISFDAATGEWLRAFGVDGSRRNDKNTCRLEGLSDYEEQECGLMGTVTLGRVIYTIHIVHRVTAEPICTIKYSEWVPNNRDGDLRMQYNSSMDQSHVYSRHDGQILALNHAEGDIKRRWTQQLPSPVVRVFDVARPANSDSRDTELVVLPQPLSPVNLDQSRSHNQILRNVFVNQTSAGGWYALSEQMYPTVTRGVERARCYDPRWRISPVANESLSNPELREALIGVHHLAKLNDMENKPPLRIDGPMNEDNESVRYGPVEESLPPSSRQDGYYISKTAVNVLLTFFTLVIGTVAFCLVYIPRPVIIDMIRKQFAPTLQAPKAQIVQSQPPSPVAANFPELREQTVQNEDEGPVVEEYHETLTEIQELPTLEISSEDVVLDKEAIVREVSPTIEENVAVSAPDAAGSAIESIAPQVKIIEPDTNPILDDEILELEKQETNSDKKDKKARRGTRGGKAHRRKKKGSKGENEVTETDNNKSAPEQNVDLAVEKALEIDNEPKPLEPDVVTVIPGGSDPTRVNDTTLQIGQLTVYEDKVLGFGSHGTRVFRGSFGGRDVAVKCMLKQLYDIAAHEVTVLQESDDHPNVIRYYMMESAGDFMYIALELCPASLAEVVERPVDYVELTGPAGLDLVDALRQIVLGIRYLHSLKMVHRDIKPENILLASPKRIPTRSDFVQHTRLLISDFGLSKKLELDQSSFRATTAHAAGTSGWRAPELLIDDENDEPSRQETLGTQYSTNSEPVVVDTITNRRVTRAIDIFALGCVFYYVLTKGNHPFDGKGRGEGKYMREANIIRGNHILDELSVLGAYQGEADDLISRMVAKKPKDRPDAAQVLAHPFFWSPTERLDFLCHVSDQFEFEPRDPPSWELETLESVAPEVIQDCRGDFLRKLPVDFVATLGKQRKYKGGHMLDLLRAMRNKKNHYEDMPDHVKARVGSLPEGYLLFWTERFPKLLMKCHQVVLECGWENKDRFRKYYTVS